MSEFEIDLCRALYNHSILDKYFEYIQGYYYCCDFEGGEDGVVTIDEIIQAVDGQGIFLDSDTPSFTLRETDVTL